MWWKIVCLLSLQFMIFYDDSNFADALIGQKVRQARSGEFPFVVSIVTLTNQSATIEGAHRCTAALITLQDVLTSEHCVFRMPPTGIVVMAGSTNLRQANAYYIAWWVSYNMWARNRPGHRRYLNNDLAIIKLTADVDGVSPAPVLEMAYEDLPGLKMYVVGWGHTSSGSTSKNLRAGKVTVLSKSACETRMQSVGGVHYDVNERRICSAANPYVLVRKGDSGGPLIYDGGIVGVCQGSGPIIEGVDFHPQQINFHFSTFVFNEFITDVMLDSHVDYN